MEKLWEIWDFYFVWTFNAVKNLQTLFNSFEGAIEVFKVKKWKIFFKILYSLINFIKALNKKIWYWIFPVLPLFMLVSKIAKPFNPEICYYLFFLDTWLKVKKVRLSQILIRKDIQKSLVLFVPKSEFEK